MLFHETKEKAILKK